MVVSDESRSAIAHHSSIKKRKFQQFDFSAIQTKHQKKQAKKNALLQAAQIPNNEETSSACPASVITPPTPQQATPLTKEIHNPPEPVDNHQQHQQQQQQQQQPQASKKHKVVIYRHGDNYTDTHDDRLVPRQRAQSRQDIIAQCRNLPIFTAKSMLLQQMSSLPTAILIGETGSGKTTQIPQYLYKAGLHKGHMIAITQPRRVAAITIAQRVALEMNSDVGNLVGYCVRFDDCTTENTKIKYMTDGMLLREAILDPLIRRYSVVLLDEAHERTIDTDVLFGVVKEAQRKRRKKHMLPLKIIVMSATMDVDHFSQYFNQAPVLYIEGRQFPVQLMYCSEAQSDYLFASVVTVFQIHQQTDPEEAVLVFLTGQEEIEAMVRSIRDIAQDLPSDAYPIVVYPLYASLPPALQLKVFLPAPKGCRKVIVSTNIAETSVTIHGIKHVVDSGMVKLKSFLPSSGLEVLRVAAVSQAQAWQRTGRAGRQSPGTCYRLYTEPSFLALPANTVPEIQRCSLSSVVLKLMALGIKDVMTFDFLDKPTPDALATAFQHLVLLEALEDTQGKGAAAQAIVAQGKQAEGQYQLTDIGRKMAAFPLDPGLAKVLLAANANSCLEEALTIVSILSSDSVLFTPHNKREEANAVHRKFVSPDGDHLTMLNIYHSYKGVNGNKQWCFDNFINQKNMKLAMEIRGQLRDICEHQDFEFKSCNRDTTAVRKSLAAGFFMNIAELSKEGHYITVSSRKRVLIHPSSSLFRMRPAVLLYNELMETNKCYIRDLSIVDPEWLYELAPDYFKRKLLAFSR